MEFKLSKWAILPLFAMVFFFSPKSHAQNFEIAPNLYDSLAPTDYFIHVSGYATFTDSITMTVKLKALDSLQTEVYSASKDFSTGGTSTITNFVYDSNTEAFSFDIGHYTSLNYQLVIVSIVDGEIKEELFIDL